MQDKILKATDDFFKQFTPQEVPDLPPAPRDFYTEYEKEYRELGKKDFPHGASGKILIDVDVALKPLRAAFNVAKDRMERLKANGDSGRAQMVLAQYMNERFMPTVEALVRTNSADELLNSKECLDTLDEYVLIPSGSGKGFTKQFVRSLYNDELGSTAPTSDMEVRLAVEEVKELTNRGQIRTAVGKAAKLLEKIETGQNTADEDDYMLLLRVATR